MDSEIFWGNMSNMTESTSSSSDETESSCSEGSEASQRLEEVNLCGTHLQIPQGLCEDAEAFKEILSKDTWNRFSDQQRQHLMNFLPSFPVNDAGEKEKTLDVLFSRENMRFGNPLTDFFDQLKAGNFRPDIRIMRKLIKKAQYREYRNQQRRYYFSLMKSLLVSRLRLLETASKGGPGTVLRPEKLTSAPPRPSPIHQRVRRRYFQELTAVREEVGDTSQSSEDENYPEGPPATLNKKQKKQLASLENSLSPDLAPIVSTLASKPSGLDLEQRVTPCHNPYDITDDAYREMLNHHRKRRLRKEDHPDLVTKGITANEVLYRCQLRKSFSSRDIKPSAKKPKLKPVSTLLMDTLQGLDEREGDASTESDDADTDKVDVEGDDDSSIPYSSASTPSSSGHFRPMAVAGSTPGPSSPRITKPPTASKTLTARRIKLELPEEPPPTPPAPPLAPPPPPPPPLPPLPPPLPPPPSPLMQPKPQTITRMLTPATLSDLDGIDMMDLPVDLEEAEMTFSPEDIKPELMQETHACFFSLLRDIICSTAEHRMTLATLEDRVRAWAASPISPLNEWYSATASDTSAHLHSALSFLAGEYPEWHPEDFVPYIDYKAAIGSYQWIGAGRDTDTHLVALCRHWAERREDMAARPIKEEEGGMAVGVVGGERQLTASPPPPRCPTQWVVQLSTPEERDVFREQERVRYENPHKAFTYRMHGYESVVGPVKGMYFQAVGNNKPRGHSLLNETRPNYVTILALVRDATARLPNGQGTRADICTLLRDSQYLIENAPDSDLNSVVSGALDRLHYEPDPCVKYDTKRKIWIYLHRARTEQEFERIHQEQQKAVKPKNPRKAHRAKVLAAAGSAEVKPEPPPKPPSKRATKAAAKPAKTPPAATAAKNVNINVSQQQSSWVQLHAVDNSQVMPDISSVEVKTEPLEKVTPIASNPPAATAPMVLQQRVIAQGMQKSLITATSFAPAKKTVTPAKTTPVPKTVPAVKTVPATKVDNSDVTKSILGKSNKQKVTGGVKGGKNVKPVKDPALSAIRRIVDTPVSGSSAVRRIPDNPVPPVMQSIVRRVPETTRGKKETSLLDSSAVAKKKGTPTTAIQGAETPAKTPAKSLVKMITSQAGVRTVQSPTQMTPQQVMLIKQGQQSYIGEPAVTSKTQQQQAMQGQQLIVMKQPADPQSATSQPQMIVINQQQIVTDQQLTAKQQKQLQQLLSKQQFMEQQQQQQQIQQLILAKQQQLLAAEQQKSGKQGAQQQMIVLKQQQSGISQAAGQEQQKPQQQLQQMILVKQQQQGQQLQQQQHVITTETQQITQQQLQLLIKQQQLQQIQATTTLPTVSQQAKGQIQTQAISLAQFQQLQQQQQQQQQRVATSASLLNQSRVATQVATQSMSTGVQVQASNLLKSQPMVAKVVTNAQGQPVISMESLLSQQKQLTSIPQTLRVATASSKPGLQPQYTVVSVAQPRVIQASQLTQAAASTVVTASVSMSGTAVGTTAGTKLVSGAATAANLRMSGINLAHIGGKPLLLASKPQSLQTQNVLVASQGSLGAGQTVLLASQNLNSAALRSQPPLTVLQQGNQQILLPPGFSTSALNIKGLQGLKVIPITPSPAAKGMQGRQQVFARIINPANMRNLVQSEQPSSSNPPSTSE